MVMVWSMAHPLFPQILLRVPEDITVIEWHPLDSDILIGGCMNGQVVIWDISDYTRKLRLKKCVWDHSIVMSNPTNKLHVEDGFIPILYWSAESEVTRSHQSPVENLKWLPKNVWFSQESAFPKVNQNEENRQFITCASEMFILVWDFLAPDTPAPEQQAQPINIDEEPGPKKRFNNPWAKLKARSTQAPPVPAGKKWSPATGKYHFLNKLWVPVHKIQFLDPTPQVLAPGAGPGGSMASAHARSQSDETPFLKVLITSLSVTDRPDLMTYERKGSTAGTNSQYRSTRAGSLGSEDSGSGRGSRSSIDRTGSAEEDDLPPPDPTNMALPTMLMAGTVIGSIFRADLSKNKVDVETNNLRKYLQ